MAIRPTSKWQELFSQELFPKMSEQLILRLVMDQGKRGKRLGIFNFYEANRKSYLPILPIFRIYLD